ncbi:uncharacterized protein KY384_003492 [Bacidia gigantensis]|uniref:uncharacterized protein n=1 Tax=Bacidia gigantensis TaxID=2732470 RepID=UPI001D03E985|nr:uncharacterized protein KY384_003492 [Bacidia gigantensis]KAG8531856.1 hypothetical protein KY384_003492 [Bacidia gigantensis]
MPQSCGTLNPFEKIFPADPHKFCDCKDDAERERHNELRNNLFSLLDEKKRNEARAKENRRELRAFNAAPKGRPDFLQHAERRRKLEAEANDIEKERLKIGRLHRITKDDLWQKYNDRHLYKDWGIQVYRPNRSRTVVQDEG